MKMATITISAALLFVLLSLAFSNPNIWGERHVDIDINTGKKRIQIYSLYGLHSEQFQDTVISKLAAEHKCMRTPPRYLNIYFANNGLKGVNDATHCHRAHKIGAAIFRTIPLQLELLPDDSIDMASWTKSFMQALRSEDYREIYRLQEVLQQQIDNDPL